MKRVNISIEETTDLVSYACIGLAYLEDFIAINCPLPNEFQKSLSASIVALRENILNNFNCEVDNEAEIKRIADTFFAGAKNNSPSAERNESISDITNGDIDAWPASCPIKQGDELIEVDDFRFNSLRDFKIGYNAMAEVWGVSPNINAIVLKMKEYLKTKEPFFM